MKQQVVWSAQGGRKQFFISKAFSDNYLNYITVLSGYF